MVALLLFRNTSIKEKIEFYSYIFLIVVFLIFQFGHFVKADFLTTYSFDSSFENLNLDPNLEHQIFIDENNTIELNYFTGNGYKTEILNKPGRSGYPETIETMVGEPRAIIFRQIETSLLLKVKGWKVELGTENFWKLKTFNYL